MRATGLRSRFSITIFLVLLTVSATSVFLYSFFLKQERRTLIDQQVRETAAALVDSELGDLRKINFSTADEIISDELGESRIGKFFIIRNQKGETIYKSSGAQLLPYEDFPIDRQWFSLTVGDKMIRGLNLKLPRIHDRTLVVGLMVDPSLMEPGYLNRNTFLFVAIILVMGMIISFLSSSYLLRPMARLAQFISSSMFSEKGGNVLPAIPDSIFKNPRPHSKDEFERVVSALNSLASRVNKNYELSRLWSYQMAHELKTPLSILQMEGERILKKNQLPPKEMENFFMETQKISETISSFLGWAELENSPTARHLFMNNLTHAVEDVIRSIPDENAQISLDSNAEVLVPANPAHVHQLVQNLVTNAVKHAGNAYAFVSIRIEPATLIIEDEGPGMTKEILERIGEPFNRGGSSEAYGRGHGLGLAWVVSICRIYDWRFEFKNLNPGLQVKIDFGRSATD